MSMTSQEILEHFKYSDEAISNIVFERGINLDFKQYTEPVFFRIKFVDCHFKRMFFLKNLVDILAELVFTNCTFDCQRNGRFSDLKLELLELNNCYSSKSLFFNRIQSNHLTIKECNFREFTYILNCEMEDSFIVNDIMPCEGEFIISCPEIAISIQAKKRIKQITINEINSASIKGNFDGIDLGTKKFEKIEINDYLELNQAVSTKIQKFNFKNSIFEGDLTLQNLHIDRLDFESLISNKGGIRMNEVDILYACFYDCTISSFYWNQVKFIYDPEIIRCDLTNLKMSNVHWKNGKKLQDSFLDKRIPWLYSMRLRWLKNNELYFLPKEISYLKYQRDTYRQLKAASIANHNQIEALAFYKNEMNLYWKEIRIEGGEKWYDRILIFLSRWVSNFGQNWFMPVLWLAGVHFIFMLCIFKWDFSCLMENGFFGEYFQLLNPIHKLPDYITTDGGKIADFFMRIFGGYFIYHFIKASRKFLEK